MAKGIILYNLAEHVTDEQHLAFVTNEKGPMLESLPSVRKYELVRIKGALPVKAPFNYMGIIKLNR